MAWENWSKRNVGQPTKGNDEPTATPIDARGILGKEHHGFWATKGFNGVKRVFENQLENASGMFGAAAESDSHVFREIEDDLGGQYYYDDTGRLQQGEESNLWDALGGKGGKMAAKVAIDDTNREVRQHVNSTLWDASKGLHNMAQALPEDWESDVDENQIPYWMKIAGGVVENAPSLAANAAMYGLNPLAGTLFTMADIAGGTTKDLRSKGLSAGDAWQAGALNSGAQMPLESLGLKTLGNIFGGKPAQAIGALGKLPILKNLKGKDPNSIRNAIAAAFVNEGIPEAAQEIPDEVISHIAEHGSMKGFDYGELASNMVDSALVGGVTGGVLATPGAIANRVRNKGETAETVAENAHVPGVTELPNNRQPTDNNAGPNEADAVVTDADESNGGDGDRVDLFLRATGQQESGNNYNAYNADGDAHGKYQITTDTYRAEAPNAGVDPNEEMTPENQEKVARHMAEKYIRLYGEDGAIVAWYAGEGTAQAFVNGTLSEEAFTRRQGENGEYPSIKEYLESVKGRMGKGGAVTATPTRTAQADQPRSAADFLKDIEDTDTLEDEEASDRIHNTLTRGTKEEQEELAREYGWNLEEEQQAQQPVQQNKAPQQAQTAAPQTTQPVQRTGTAEPITTTKQNTGTTQQANTANGAPTKQNAAPATKAVVPTTNNNNPQATDPAQTIVGNQPQPAPMHASPVDSGRTPVEQPQAEQPKTNKEKIIRKAKTNERLKTLVRQAFVEGNADAKQILDNQNINKDVLEAVKGEIIPNYTPQGTANAGVVDANARRGVQTTPSITIEPYTPTETTTPTGTTNNPANNALPSSSASNNTPIGRNVGGNTQNTTTNTQNGGETTKNTQNSTTKNAQNGSAVQNGGSDNTSNGTKTPVKGKKSPKNGGKKAAKTPVEDKETTEIKKDEPSKDTSKSNTEEKTNETTKEIRELLPETNKDKHGDTKSEEGSKSESENSEKTETKDTVKDDADKAGTEERTEGDNEKSTGAKEDDGRDTSDNKPFNSPMSENERQIYDKADPDIKSNEWEDVTQTPETLERARDEAKNDGGPRLSTESSIRANGAEQCVITDDCFGGFSLLGWYISNVFKSPKLKGKNAEQNILTLARVLGGKQVTVDNEEAVHAWEKVGFKVVARKDRGNGKYEYELVANADSPTVAVEKIKNGEYKPSAKEELEGVPTFPTDDIGAYKRFCDYVDACREGNAKKQAKILAEQKAAEKAAKDVEEIHNKAKADMDKVIEGYKNGKGNKKVAEQAISAIAKKARGEIAMADPKRFVPLTRDRFNELVADKRAELKDAKRENVKKLENETTPKKEPATDTANAEDAAQQKGGDKVSPTGTAKAHLQGFKDKANKILSGVESGKKDAGEAFDEIIELQNEAHVAIYGVGNLNEDELLGAIGDLTSYGETVRDKINEFAKDQAKASDEELASLDEDSRALIDELREHIANMYENADMSALWGPVKLYGNIREYAEKMYARAENPEVKRIMLRIANAYQYATLSHDRTNTADKAGKVEPAPQRDVKLTAEEENEIKLAAKHFGEDSELYQNYYLPAVKYLVHFRAARKTATESAFLYAKMAESFHANYGIWFPAPWFGRTRMRGVGGIYINGVNILAMASIKSENRIAFLHEATHLYESMLVRFSEMTEQEMRAHFGGNVGKAMAAQKAIKKDLASIADWTKYSKEHLSEYEGTLLSHEFNQHAAMVRVGRDPAEDVWRKERLARGAEKYFATGEAPTSVLKRFFERLKQALVSYVNDKTVMKGELPPEVKAFYDKMVAGDPNFFKETAKPKERKLKKATVYTDDGNKFEVTYKIVPADTLVSSSDYDFAKNDKYPSELQPRDRDRSAMVTQVDKMARNLRTDDLMEAQNVNQGAPVINQDNVVENGNGRVMAITRAYKHGGDAYTKSGEAYKKSLVENAEKYGYTQEEVDAMENPVLVRQRGKESDSMQTSIITSTTGGMRMGAAQQAQVDAKKISDDTMQLLKYDEAAGADLTKSVYSNFVSAALNDIGGEQERDALFQRDGAPSAEGIRRVRAALAAKAYGESEIIDRAFESTDADSKNIINAFIAAAPKVSIVKARLEEGTVDGAYNLPKILTEALGFFLKAKADGKDISFALNENSLFGGAGAEISNPQTRLLVQFFDSHTRSQKAIISAIDQMVDGILANNMNMDSMFVDVVEPVSMDDIIRTAVGLRASIFEAKKPGKDGKPKIQIRKLAFGAMSKEHIAAISDLAAANGGRLNTKTGAITFKDAESQANALAILEAYYAATSKETDMLKFSMIVSEEKVSHKIKKATGTGYALTQKAWNGSPADFDKFDLSFIGTGEGNQAHGWGIYFALAVPDRGLDDYGKKVSEGYKERIGGENGHLYQAVIPSANYLLDEQAALKDQPKHVQDAIKKAFEILAGREHDIRTDAGVREEAFYIARDHLAQAEYATVDKLITNKNILKKIFDKLMKTGPEKSTEWNIDEGMLDYLYNNVFDKAAIDELAKRNAELETFDFTKPLDASALLSQERPTSATVLPRHKREAVKSALWTAYTDAKSEIDFYTRNTQEIVKDAIDWNWGFFAPRITSTEQLASDLTYHFLRHANLRDRSDVTSRTENALRTYVESSRNAKDKLVLRMALSKAYEAAEPRFRKKKDLAFAIDVTIAQCDRVFALADARRNRDLSMFTGEEIQNFFYRIIADTDRNLGVSRRLDKAVALLLKDAGLKGYKYYGGRDGACAVVFDEAAMKIINKFSRKGPMETLRSSITKFCSASDLTSREKAIAAFAKKMGMTVQFFEGDPNLHGFHADGTNAVFLNRKSAMDLNKVFWHETFHWMRENNSDLYNQLVKEVFCDKVSMQQLADYAASIGRTDMSMELCIEEMLADAMFDAGKRGSFFEKIGVEHPSLCAKLLKWISNLYKDFTAHFRNPEAGLTNTQVKRMAASLSDIANRITNKNGDKLFAVDEKGNIKETAAGRAAISADVKYKVTNKNVKPDTQVKITDVTNAKKTNPFNAQERTSLLDSLVGQTFTFNGGTGEVVIDDTQHAPGENRKAGNHLMFSSAKLVYQAMNATRQKALTMLADIFRNGIYIDKHADKLHGKGTKYIEIFAPVRNGDKIYTFQITARERGRAGLYKIGKAIYYNVKKVGTPLMRPDKGQKFNGLPTSTVSVAEMLEGVNDRDGNPYVNADGSLNYQKGLFRKAKKGNVHLLSDSPTTDQSSSKLKAQLMSNFPNAQNIVEDENHIAFDLPSGTHVEANIVEDTIGVDWSKAQEDYGGTLTGKEKALGKLETVDRDAIITLTKDTVEEAPSHEAMHLAMGFLNENERSALMKKYGNEEAICEAMREWKIRRSEGKGTSMGKLMQKISDIAYKLLGLFHETDKNVFRKLESGELWEREADNKAAAKVSYMLDPSNAASDFLDAVASGDIKFSMDNKGPAPDGVFEYLVKAGEPGDTIGHTADGVYRKSSASTVKVTFKEKPDIWKAFSAGKGRLADQAIGVGQKVKAKVKSEVHAAEQNPHIRKAERGKETGWGAIEWVLNNTIKSPSRIASFAARRIYNLADAANRRMQRLYGDWTNSFARAVQKLDDAEKEKFNDILWAEDANQHVYSDAELKEMGCSDNVIRAHKKTRNLLRKIYNAVNDTYTRTKVENRFYKTLKGAQKAQADLLKRPHTEVFRDIKEITRNGEKQYQVSVRTRGYREISTLMTQDEIDQLKQDKDCFVKNSKPALAKNENGEQLFEVTYLAYNKALTDLEGYMPHLFHGIMIIRTTKDADGKAHNEVVGSAETMDKAIVLADKMQQEEGGEFLLTPKQFSSEGELESPLFLGDKDYDQLMDNLRDGMSLSLEDAREISKARKKGRHISYSGIKKRKGAKGFETNAIWAIQHHIGASARYVALDPFKADAISFFERRFGDLDDDWSGKNREAAFIKGYIDSMLGKPGVLEKVANSFLRLFPMFKDEARPAQHLAGNLTALTGVLKLGASPAAGFVNMLQILNCVGYVGAKKTAVGIKRALHPTSTDIRILKSAGADEEVGLAFDGVGKVPLERTKYSKTAETIENIREKLMLPFTAAERTIRRATILAAYYDYVEKNKGRIKDPGDLRRLALEHANEINRKVNFDYSVTDAPRIFRAVQGTVIGDVALQFQKYGVKELEVIADFLPIIGKNTSTAQKVKFFVPYLLVGGLWNAFPFEDAILALLGMLFGIDDPEKEVKKAMIGWAGKDPTKKAIVDVANYGAGSIVGMDISQRVGLKGVVPETSNITQGGPFGSTAVQLAKAIVNGDMNGGLKAVSPFAGNVYGAYVGYNTDSKGRKTVDYDGWDRAMRAAGFRTVKEAHATDAQAIVYNYKQSKKADREKAKEAYFDDPSDKNYQKLRDLGYSKTDIKGFKNSKNTTRAERAESGLSKDDKEKLKSVFDYAK